MPSIAPADELLERFLGIELHDDPDREVKRCVAELAALTPADRAAVEPRLIELLTDEELVPGDRYRSEYLRSWATILLGAVHWGRDGESDDSRAWEALVSRVGGDGEDVEESSLLRQWSIRVLARVFASRRPETVARIAEALDREEIVLTRWVALGELAKSGDPQASPALVAAIDDPYQAIRIVAAQGLAALGTRVLGPEAAVAALAGHLEEGRPAEGSGIATLWEWEVWVDESQERRAMIKALSAIGGPGALDALVQEASAPDRDVDIAIAAVIGLGELGKRDGERNRQEVVGHLLEIVEKAPRKVAQSAADALREVLSEPDAAKCLVQRGLEPGTRRLDRVAEGLRLIDRSRESVRVLEVEVERKGTHGERARELLLHLGGKRAFDALWRERKSRLDQTREHLNRFRERVLDEFQGTIALAKRAFWWNLRMNVCFFAIGVALVVTALILAVLSESHESLRMVAGGAGAAGIASLAAIFYRGPLQQIRRGLEHLVQVEVAFEAYQLQMAQAHALFEREYLDNDGFTVTQLSEFLQSADRTMKDTIQTLSALQKS